MSTRAQVPGQVGESALSLSGGKSIPSDWPTLDEVGIDRVLPPKLCSEFVWELLTRMCPELILTNEGVLWGCYSVIAAALVINHPVAPSWAESKYIHIYIY